MVIRECIKAIIHYYAWQTVPLIKGANSRDEVRGRGGGDSELAEKQRVKKREERMMEKRRKRKRKGEMKEGWKKDVDSPLTGLYLLYMCTTYRNHPSSPWACPKKWTSNLNHPLFIDCLVQGSWDTTVTFRMLYPYTGDSRIFKVICLIPFPSWKGMIKLLGLQKFMKWDQWGYLIQYSLDFLQPYFKILGSNWSSSGLR